VLLDKTGTLTLGTPQIRDVVSADGFTEREILIPAAIAERKSEHPLAKANYCARERPVSTNCRTRPVRLHAWKGSHSELPRGRDCGRQPYAPHGTRGEKDSTCQRSSQRRGIRSLRRQSRANARVVMDNYGTHKQPAVQAWLKRHPRFVPHFVPTSSSWLNLVERWFGELTSKRVRRGSFRSVEELEQAIAEFLAAWNEKPKPFVWTATVDSIVEKLSRCRQTLERIRPGCTLPRTRKRKH
jgi:transposase